MRNAYVCGSKINQKIIFYKIIKLERVILRHCSSCLNSQNYIFFQNIFILSMINVTRETFGCFCEQIDQVWKSLRKRSHHNRDYNNWRACWRCSLTFMWNRIDFTPIHAKSPTSLKSENKTDRDGKKKKTKKGGMSLVV